MTNYIENTPLSIDLGFIIDPTKPVVSLAIDVYDAYCSETHKHPRAQLIYSSKGVMKIVIKNSIWLVSANQAIWVPPMVEHQVFFIKENHVRNLFLDPSVTGELPEKCFAFNVSPFFRELVLKIVNNSNDYFIDSPQGRLISILLDELKGISPSKCILPTTYEPRIKRILDILMNNPGDKRDINAFADLICVSNRTLMRLFTREVGMSFSDWRKQARLMAALEMLAKDVSVNQVSLELGYNGPSAFVEMFRKEFGSSPTKYLKKDWIE